MTDIFTTIKPASEDDAGSIYELEMLCSLNPWNREALCGRISDPQSIFLVLTAEPAREIVGFACSSLILDELQIYEVAVHPNQRGKGFGTKLINSLLLTAAAKGATRASLEVRISNRSAIRIYEKNGFTMDGIRKGYYQNGEDAALMSAEIRSEGCR